VIDGPADRNGRTPTQVVREYLALRREWDLSTAERVSGVTRGELTEPNPGAFDWSAAAVAWSELRRLRQQWCTPEAVARAHARASFGTSSDFNPDVEILEVRHAPDGHVTLRTREYPFDADGTRLPTDYEYEIRRINNEWRLDSRASEGVSDLL
jgi:hypothetical protein